jgi:hypothetical protein
VGSNAEAGRFWRSPAETVAKVDAGSGTGSVIFRSTRKASKISAKGTFSKVAGEWRIASLQRGAHLLAPAGLIFTDGEELDKELWPLHC